jgi:histidyl-tRNA synthetase
MQNHRHGSLRCRSLSAMFQALSGMRDLQPPDTDRWRLLVQTYAEHAQRAGYGEIIPPMMEELGVFLRIGDSTDVVTKEMYDFVDKDGKRIALRPEFTASLCRVFVQRRPQILPWKVWSWGAAFRHEKPQAGRYRQFMQLDAECIGSNDPDIDVEMISFASDFFRSLGLRQFTVKLNSLGDKTTRPAYLTALRSYLDAHAADLTAESRATLAINPIRVLDSKREPDQQIIAGAPQIAAFLEGSEAGAHFARVQEGLRSIDVPFVLDPRLVRGLDYYTHTLFEFASDALKSAQNAIGGGGHYNDLIEQLGGPSTPGIGFALGIDRILMACDEEGVFGAPPSSVDVFVVDTTGGAEATKLVAELRRASIGTERAFEGKSMKSQMKVSDRSGARFAVIIGSNELEQGTVVLRTLRGEGVQESILRADVVSTLTGLLRVPT